jgi:GT2 family glycosyltransferase
MNPQFLADGRSVSDNPELDTHASVASIAVIILNWNGADDTIACLESLLDAEPPPASIIVVDNKSGDGSLSRIEAWVQSQSTLSSPIAILASERNRGFAGGNNLGLAHAMKETGATHFLLLNNDTVVDRNILGAFERAIRERPDGAMFTATILEHNTNGRVWYAGGWFQPWRALTHHHRERPRSDNVVQTSFVTGCTMLLSRSAVEMLGPLPECYFPAYVEDTEYSYRAVQRGLGVWYVPAAVVSHKVGASTAAAPRATVVRWLTRHRAFFVRRNLRGAERALALAYLVMTKPARAIAELLRGRPDVAWATVAGTVEGLFSSRARVG